MKLRRISHVQLIACLTMLMALALTADAAPGDLDTTFDPGAVLWQGNAFPAFKYASVVQPDGKIVIGGRFDTVAGVSRNYIARFNPNGSLDTTFTSPLQIFVNGGTPDGEVYDIILQPNGQFLVCGYFVANGTYKTVVRLNSDGTLDTLFDVTTNNGDTTGFNLIYRMLLQPDGKVVIGSNSLQSVNGVTTNYLARLTPSGALDSALGVTGNVTYSVFALALQSDGKILVAGSFGVVARLNTDGTEDPGWSYPDIGGGTIDSLAIESDGQILIGSRSRLTVNGALTDGLVRVNPNGSLDTTFNPPDIRAAFALYVQSDGKIAVGGSFTVNFGLYLASFGRLNQDGSLDFRTNPGADNDVFDITRQFDGKYIIVGAFENFNQASGPVVRTGIARVLDGAAPPPPLTGRIVFDSKPTSTFLEIASINPDGTNRTPLTSTGFDYNPSVSSNGSKIAFLSLRDNTFEEIYIMNGDGSGQARLTTDDNFDNHPAISPDGSKIAFASLRSGNWDIYVINSNGMGEIRLTTGGARDDEPAFSPDGSKVVFRSDRDGNAEIYVMDANGANQTRLTTTAAGITDVQPAFSPDGSKIVFQSTRDGNPEIYSMSPAGTNVIRLTNTTAIDRDPTFSPDGSRIAFVTNRDGSDEVYYMNADGSSPTRITNNSFEDGRPSWGANPAPPPAPTLKMTIAGGNMLVGSPGAGLILRSPSGAVCIKIGIDNAGTLTNVIVPCP